LRPEHKAKERGTDGQTEKQRMLGKDGKEGGENGERETKTTQV
jgi:hypothetical protein